MLRVMMSRRSSIHNTPKLELKEKSIGIKYETGTLISACNNYKVCRLVKSLYILYFYINYILEGIDGLSPGMMFRPRCRIKLNSSLLRPSSYRKCRQVSEGSIDLAFLDRLQLALDHHGIIPHLDPELLRHVTLLTDADKIAVRL